MVFDAELFQRHFCCRIIRACLSLREMFSPAANILTFADCADEQRFSRTRLISDELRSARLPLGPSAAGGGQFLISNRRTADHGPETPPLFALTRHHILSVGSALVLN
jgi:hypothetical protein